MNSLPSSKTKSSRFICLRVNRSQWTIITGSDTKHKIFYPPKQLSNAVADPLLELEQLWSLDGGGSVKMNILRLLVLHTPL
jgi:hypothetical protein